MNAFGTYQYQRCFCDQKDYFQPEGLLIMDLRVPIIGMLHNIKDQRWHPILFFYNPLSSCDGPVRHKSKGHHTVGFPTREEALANANGQMVEFAKKFGEPLFCLEKDFPWDGDPSNAAMVVFFGESEGKVVPMF